MAERNYRKYTEEFKLEALAVLNRGQKKAGQIERELGITPGLLLKWRARYQGVANGNGEVHLEPSDLEAAKAEIRRLQQKLAEVEEEREILKKARIVGWAMDEHRETSLVQNAWNMAVSQRTPSAELLHHSDQGSQYTSDLYQQSLAAHHCQVSMSQVGNCFDNAAMESFFSTLKTECADHQFDTRAQARTVIFEYIEAWYNRQRLHSTLDYLSPVEFERKSRHSSCP